MGTDLCSEINRNHSAQGGADAFANEVASLDLSCLHIPGKLRRAAKFNGLPSQLCTLDLRVGAMARNPTDLLHAGRKMLPGAVDWRGNIFPFTALPKALLWLHDRLNLPTL
jgi:hypothetical protein